MDDRDRVAASEVLEAFSEALLDMVVFDMFESREGGSISGKEDEDGDCSLDDDTGMTMGEEAEVPAGLRLTAPGRDDPGELVGPLPPPPPPATSCDCSLTPPTEALKRLYRPLKPPWTSSMPLASPAPGGDRGAVRSSKVVSVSVRDAVACIWWRSPCSEPCASRAMAMMSRTRMRRCSRTLQAYAGGEEAAGCRD